LVFQLGILTPTELKVASLIGVPESYVARKASLQKCRMVGNKLNNPINFDLFDM